MTKIYCGHLATLKWIDEYLSPENEEKRKADRIQFAKLGIKSVPISQIINNMENNYVNIGENQGMYITTPENELSRNEKLMIECIKAVANSEASKLFDWEQIRTEAQKTFLMILKNPR